MKTLLLFGLMLAPAAGAGVDGQWAATDAGGASGVVLELKSEGGALSGWLSQPNGKMAITNGSIRGNSLSFEMAVMLQGQALTLLYSGELERDEMHLTMRVRGRTGEERFTLNRVDPSNPLDRFSEPAAPDGVTAWLRGNAVRLASLRADATFADLMPLKARLADARVVAMGEATHGTREFQQLKIRMFRFLVEELGFTVFGIEANWPESLAVNRYVLGEGVDPIARSGFSYWQTEDMLELLRWMREYNRMPEHTRKLKFYGFDMQVPGLAEATVLDYLRRVDADAVAGAGRVFDVLGYWGDNPEYASASDDVKRGTAASLTSLLLRFDARKREYVARSSLRDWTMARQNLVIVTQAEVKLGKPDERGKIFRDRAMAENVKWILEQEPAGSRMMLWAHNGHVAAAAPLDGSDHLPMGGHLREFFRDRLVSCGFVFREGGFRAVDMAANRMSTFTAGPPPGGSLDATLASVGIPLFAVDLRGLPKGGIRDWFAAPHYSRQIGGGYSEATPGVWIHRVRAALEFDVLLFVAQTTPSR